MMVLLTLNIVWKMDIPTLLIRDAAKTGFSLNTTNMTHPKMTAPTTLKRR